MNIDYTYEPNLTPQQAKVKAGIQKEAHKLAKEVSKHYSACIATMIKMFCDKHKCDLTDVAIFQEMKAGKIEFWVDFKTNRS